MKSKPENEPADVMEELKAEDEKKTGAVLQTYFAQSARLRIEGLSRESRFNDGSINKSAGAVQFENHFFGATTKAEMTCIENSKGFLNGKDVIKADDKFMAKFHQDQANKRKQISPRQTREIDMSYLQKD